MPAAGLPGARVVPAAPAPPRRRLPSSASLRAPGCRCSILWRFGSRSRRKVCFIALHCTTSHLRVPCVSISARTSSFPPPVRFFSPRHVCIPPHRSSCPSRPAALWACTKAERLDAAASRSSAVTASSAWGFRESGARQTASVRPRLPKRVLQFSFVCKSGLPFLRIGSLDTWRTVGFPGTGESSKPWVRWSDKQQAPGLFHVRTCQEQRPFFA